MPLGQAWYVEGQKRAFPYGLRLVSGPFDTSALASAEAVRLRPYYPDAELRAKLHRAKSLPVRKPRGTAAGERQGSYDLRNAPGRRAAAEAIATYAQGFGAAVTLEDWDGEPDVDMVLPSGRAHVWLGWTPAAPMPIVSWIAGRDLQLRAVLPGAWREPYAHRKATSLPADWAELFDMLGAGLCGLIDGSALE